MQIGSLDARQATSVRDSAPPPPTPPAHDSDSDADGSKATASATGGHDGRGQTLSVVA